MKPFDIPQLTEQQRQTLATAISKPLVKIGKLAKELGVDRVMISHMPPGVSGQISIEDDQYIIRVTRYDSKERQRFTIAHELAHFLLHKHIIDNKSKITDTILYRSNESSEIEMEANRLAADIIMPAEPIRRAVKEEFDGYVTDEIIEELAGRCVVSNLAMEIRLSAFPQRD